MCNCRKNNQPSPLSLFSVFFFPSPFFLSPVSAFPPRYLDVVNRLDPVVVALEMEDRPVLVVSHQVNNAKKIQHEEEEYEKRTWNRKNIEICVGFLLSSRSNHHFLGYYSSIFSNIREKKPKNTRVAIVFSMEPMSFVSTIPSTNTASHLIVQKQTQQCLLIGKEVQFASPLSAVGQIKILEPGVPTYAVEFLA